MNNNNQGIVLYTSGQTLDDQKKKPSGYSIHGYHFIVSDNIKNTKIPLWNATQNGYVEKSDKSVKILDITNNDIDNVINSKENYLVEITKYLDWYKIYTSFDIASTQLSELRALELALDYVLDVKPLIATIYTNTKFYKKITEDLTKKIKITTSNENANPLLKKVKEHTCALLNRLKEKILAINKSGIKCNVVKVLSPLEAGYKANIGIEKAYKLATIAANLSNAVANDKVIEETEYRSIIADEALSDYWKDDAEPHPFLLESKKMYWNPEHDGKNNTYYLGNLGHNRDTIQTGKCISDCGYAVVMLNKVDEVLECIKDLQKEYFTKYGFSNDCIVAAALSDILSKKRYNDILKYMTKIFKTPSRNRPDLYDINDVVITEVMIPPYLSMRSLLALSDLEEKARYFNDNLSSNNIYTVNDVTQSFYEPKYKVNNKTKESVISGFVLSKDLVTGSSSIKLPLSFKYLDNIFNDTVTLSFGIDIPSRNIFKRIENMLPEVYVITENVDGDLFKYYCFIRIKSTGEFGIWSASHSNTYFHFNKSTN
jgi:hypothetical protein